MKIPKNILEGIKEIQDNNIDGSSIIAMGAITIFGFAVMKDNITDVAVLKEIANKLINAKQEMPAIKNVLSRCIREIEAIKGNTNIERFTEVFINNYNNIVSASEETLNNTIDFVNNKYQIKKPLSIITCSYSSAVISFLEVLKEKNIKYSVNAISSIWNSIDYAQFIKKECEELKVKCDIIPYDKFSEVIETSDFMIIGADAVLPDGSIINGIPSKELTQIAKDKIDIYVIAESYKKTEKYSIKSGFDKIESQYITKLFTDEIYLSRNLY